MLLQVSDTLKKFAVKVNTASVKERKEIFGDLKRCIKGKGESLCLFFNLSTVRSSVNNNKLWNAFVLALPEPAIKGLCKLFCLTPHRYRWVSDIICNSEGESLHSVVVRGFNPFYPVCALQGCCITQRAALYYWPAGWKSAWHPGNQPAPLPAQQWSHQQNWRAQVMTQTSGCI